VDGPVIHLSVVQTSGWILRTLNGYLMFILGNLWRHLNAVPNWIFRVAVVWTSTNANWWFIAGLLWTIGTELAKLSMNTLSVCHSLLEANIFSSWDLMKKVSCRCQESLTLTSLNAVVLNVRRITARKRLINTFRRPSIHCNTSSRVSSRLVG